MRTMRNTCGMQGDHATGHILAAHEIAVYIIQHFIAVDIAVVIRCRNGLRMIIEEAWTKRAYHKIMRFEKSGAQEAAGARDR